MKDQRKIEIKVGIFSILGTILLLIGLIVGRGMKVAVSMQTIKFRFPNSAGLQISSPVMVNGVKRGTVSQIQNDNGSVLVLASIDNTEDFRKDVRAKIYMLEVTGGKKIEISPGVSDERFDPNTEIPGITASDIPELIANLEELFDQARTLIVRLNTTLGSTDKLFGDKNFIRQTKEAIENANQILMTSRDIIQSNQENLKQIIKDLRSLLSNIKKDYSKYEPRIDSLTFQIDNISHKTNNLLNSADNSLRSVDSMLIRINSILEEIKSGNGVVNRIIYDRNFAIRLDSAVGQINELIQLIRSYGVNVNLRLGTRP